MIRAQKWQLAVVLLVAVTGSDGFAGASAGGSTAGDSVAAVEAKGDIEMYPELKAYMEARGREAETISVERRIQLDEFAAYIATCNASGKPARLIFVCTHNSRRSQMSMLTAAAAAAMHGVDVITYSGGTESTAFNPRAAGAIERAGFKVVKTTDDVNPVYHVSISEDIPAMTCFSKKYDGDPNPKSGFAAVMVCDDADEKCPVVVGAEARFPIKYVDPKVSDGTKAEEATYDERCAQIAREMMYTMARAAGG